MRDATRAFATGRTGEAIAAYGNAGMVHAADTRDAARAALIERWDAERQAEPARSRIILTHTNTEVAMLNQAARQKLAERGELGRDVTVATERGARQFADNDRILFLQNERGLAVKNGSLGTVEQATRDQFAVRLDDGRHVKVDLKTYAHVDHGYAATVHKTQGMTVDRTHVLATPGLDAHATYVALSRHRVRNALHYGRDDFADESQLRRTLSRERPRDMAMDYEAAAPASAQGTPTVPSRATDSASSSTSAVRPAADTDRVSMLRAMIAARLSAPRPTAESKAAMAAAKAAPAAERDYDNGAER